MDIYRGYEIHVDEPNDQYYVELNGKVVGRLPLGASHDDVLTWIDGEIRRRKRDAHHQEDE